ncbi:amino acid adenylation domain-containing protein [Variovorax paradoxus]|uniref:non-ribosomal peptide synthetase n=1 Tax=Variovorax paradoxus TaxID=34073 RepID=UPI001932C18C|nr:amino acid adenylation domain-containing protein [Variovorax paradoxus]
MSVTSTIAPTPDTTFPLSAEQRAVPAGAARLLLSMGIDGTLDAAALRIAVESVLRAHGALCAAIRQVPGYRGPRQQYFDEMPPLTWRSAELGGAADGALDAWLEAFNAEPLAIERGEVVGAALLRTGAASHTLALSLSPLVADRESLQNLFDQIATASLGEGALDPEDIFQHARFVEWREDLLEGEDADQGRAYWQRLATEAAALAPPRLLAGRGGAPADAARRIVAEAAIDAALATRVTALAEALGTQPETLLQAAWWLLMARLHGAGRFVGGWQHDCRRDYAPMQGAVGLFDKVLPVLVDVAEDESFAHWTGRLDAALAAHVEVQEYWPVDAPPIAAQAAVGFVSHEAPRQHGSSVRWRLTGLPGPMPGFELALQAAWGTDGAQLSLHADAARHGPAALDRLLLQFVTLLEAAVAQPAAPVGTLPLVGPRERALLLAHDTPPLDVGTQTVAERVAHWARTTPDAAALAAGTQCLGYREFDEGINRLAHWLVAQGVTPGAIVALNLPRSVDLPLAMFAAWRAGAAYLPLEPGWPEARRAAVLADARPALVLEGALPALDGLPAHAPAHRIAPNDLAYVLYTSGSTGTPKGVAIEHGQLLNYVAAASAAMKLDGCRRWALTSSVVADLGNTALFGAFFNGACLVVASGQEAKDARAFADFMERHAIDALKIVPSHLEALLECEAPRLPRTLVLGGEAAPRALVERIAALAPQCAIYNHYGPTETTVGVMVHAVTPGAPLPAQLPLTQVLANNRVRVLDAALALVPAGGLGEVYVGGAQLCRGYLNREPGDAFVADPFAPGERLYRTGDLAHVLADGGLCLAGRADHQVKVHGFRVEPAEIEAVLLAQPGVRQAVVLAAPDAAGATALSAFFVADGASADGHALRERLAALLPAHMVPASFTALEAFARLPNGKIDRLALSVLAPAAAERKVHVAPRDALEAVLAEGMATLLGSDPIGVEDDFFELGGHSLQVIKLVARIRKLLQVEVAAGLVFDHPTPAALAAALREASGDAQALERLAQAARQPEPSEVGEAA